MLNKPYLTIVFLLFWLVTSTPGFSLAACAPPAIIAGQTYSYIPISVQDAYDFASSPVSSGGLGLSNFTLRLPSEIIYENLTLDGGLVTFDGGYECDYLTRTSSPTGIFGTFTVTTGAANFAGNIAIVSTDLCSFDKDSDGFFAGSCAPTPVDCNDNDAGIYPGAIEVCDGVDNNCDSQIDEGALPIDADGDGYFGSDACGAVAEDCDDLDPSIYPGAPEIAYDGIDQDCNGSDLRFDANMNACEDCHVPDNQLDGVHYRTQAPDGNCISCHAALVNNILSGHYGRTVQTPGNNMSAGETIVCASCHDQDTFEHPGGAHVVWAKVETAGPWPQLPNLTCYTCHTGHDHNGISGTADCVICHNTGDPQVLEIVPLHADSCALCHNSPRQQVIDAISSGAAECTTCHAPHDHNGISGTADCVGCHNTGDPQVLEIVPLHANSCVICHDSPRQQVIDAISSGAAECLDCHTGHEHTGVTGSPDCTSCHTHSDPLIIEVIHSNSCALCHDSTRQEVIDAISSGMAECNDCHGAHDGPAAHDNLSAPASCAACHTDKVSGSDFNYLINNHGPHPTLGYTELERCQRCHNSTEADVVNTINSGKGPAGIAVTCENCHISQHLPIDNPVAIHDYILEGTGSFCGSCHDTSFNTHADIIATTGCANCHASANQDEYNALHQNDCLLCHLSPRTEVITAIYGGIAGATVECTSCHSVSWETIHSPVTPDHSGIVTATNTSCASCHEDTLLGASSTSHFSCNSCHDAATGPLISIAAGKMAPGDCTTCHGSDLQNLHTGCFSCHDTPPSGATPPNGEGAHFEHEALISGVIFPTCVACHNGAGLHNNGTINVNFTSSFDAQSGVASSNGSTCSNISCHGGQTTPAWETGTIDVNTQCTACHAEGTPTGTLQYNDYAYGWHGPHIADGIDCWVCHNTATLAFGHFTNLETPTFEQNPADTIGGGSTNIGSYDGAFCFNTTGCHGVQGAGPWQ